MFYPACFAVMIAALAGLRWPTSIDPILVALLPVPVVVEWWLERLDVIDYSALRNVATSLICAPAVGVGLARYLQDQTDPLFWSVVASYAVICLIPVFLRIRRPATRTDT